MDKDIITNTEELLTLKQAAERFDCAQTTLKRWVKNNDIEYTKNATKAYLVDPDKVEAKLRSSSKVASIYHPKPKKELSTDTPTVPVPIAEQAKPTASKVEQVAEPISAPVAKTKPKEKQKQKYEARSHPPQQAPKAKKPQKHRLPDLEWTYRGVQKLGVEDLVKLRNRINSLLNGFN